MVAKLYAQTMLIKHSQEINFEAMESNSERQRETFSQTNLVDVQRQNMYTNFNLSNERLSLRLGCYFVICFFANINF